MFRRALTVTAFALICAGAPGSAQPAAQSEPVQTPLLIVDQEELFRRSAFGQRIRSDIALRLDDLAAENRRIETELVAEEQALTAQRETLDAAEFSQLANAFDVKVTRVRAEQDAKSAAIENASDQAQQAFFSRVAQVLGQIMRERGAVAIIDGRAVLLSVDAMDITQDAIARIDAEIGDGLRDDDRAPTPQSAPADPQPDAPAQP